jgi:hypothetical protein
LGGLHNIEKEEECSDIEKKGKYDRSKSQTAIGRGGAIEAIGGTAADLRMAYKTGQNSISMR